MWRTLSIWYLAFLIISTYLLCQRLGPSYFHQSIFQLLLTHRIRHEVLPTKHESTVNVRSLLQHNSFDAELQVKRDNGLSVFKDTFFYLLSLFHSCIEMVSLCWTSTNNWQYRYCGSNRFYTKKGIASGLCWYIWAERKRQCFQK